VCEPERKLDKKRVIRLKKLALKRDHRKETRGTLSEGEKEYILCKKKGGEVKIGDGNR